MTTTRHLTRRSLLGAGALAALGITGCGGGSGIDIAGVSTGGTGSFSTGTIVGFGSIIVNGIRYDDSLAEVRDLDGSLLAGTQPLRLGMTVAVLGDDPVAVTGASYAASAKAAHIAVLAELVGPVDATTPVLRVLGQAVDVSDTTVIEGPVTQLSDLRTGDWVEVHGVWDAVQQHWHAGRIQVLGSVPAKARLTADVSSVDGARLTAGGVTIDATAAALPANLAVGDRIRLRLAAAPVGGVWQADMVRRADLTALPQGPWAELERDEREAEIEGVIDAVQGTRLSLRGITVDASAVPGAWRMGDRVEVKGRLQGGVLVAQRIEIDDDASRIERGFELHATVEQVNAGTFTARGLTVIYDAATVALKAGDRIEAKLRRTADGRWQAVSIEVEGAEDDARDDDSPESETEEEDD